MGMELFVLIIALIPTFFYKLGDSSLVAWDEAWYGEISKQLINSGNLWVMKFNSLTFTDHPPTGFWLMSLGQTFFGINEFGVRVAAAVCGLLTVVGTYFLGKEMFGKLSGWFAAIALVSAPWFLLRSRSGNLDVFVTCFLVWTIYFAIKAVTKKKYIWGFLICFNLLVLSKTMIVWTVVPALIFIFSKAKIYKFKEWLGIIFLSLSGFGFWVWNNTLDNNQFWQRYLFIGAPGVGGENDLLANIKQVKNYLYFGIGRWFWLTIVALGLGILSRKKEFLILGLVFGVFMVPFLGSDRGNIWHMIPVIPFMLIALFGLLEKMLVFKGVKLVVMMILLLVVGLPQFNRYWFEVVDKEKFVSDEKILAIEARNYPGLIRLQDDYFPTIVYYSDKKVLPVSGTLGELLESEPRPFLLITRDYRLGEIGEAKNPWRIVKKDRDKVLIEVPRLY